MQQLDYFWIANNMLRWKVPIYFTFQNICMYVVSTIFLVYLV